ncbi:TIGR03960 family B12-binding radical SAM protein [Wukongibacter baidiensis]|uniref:TIGR03960 family B12-binding radical SAM protein n=1 Tax=Wukongibacter baidiensis TaxID=1723361 RepID=UPI003D7FE833
MNERIEEILYKVEKPSRYIGGEINSYKKDINENLIRFGFAFPDTYEVGMSHLGMHIIYNLLNEVEDVYCERIFAPWIDMEEVLREEDVPLFTLETRSPMSDLDIIGFTLQYELSYSNILNMLNLGKIPLRSSERDESHPIIIAGGPCSYNPEPLAEIVDIVTLGESEESLIEVLDIYREIKSKGFNRDKFLEEVSKIEGIYVPSFYEVSYKEDGTIESVKPKKEEYPAKVKKRIIKDLNDAFYPEKVIVPFADVVHNRAMIEIFRGCTRGCRFCQAGMIYRPIRERTSDKALELVDKLLKNTGFEEISISSLSTSDYSELNEFVRALIDKYLNNRVGISVPSLRLDSFSIKLIEEIQKVRKTGLTFAPEAGTQRLRDVINKGVVEKDLIDAVSNAFGLGWSTVKLYFMIGLPTETYDDLDGIADLGRKVVDSYYNVPKEKRNKGLKVTISTSSFVPKPFTPFQWEPQDKIDDLIEKQNHLKGKLKHKNISYNYHDSKTSFLEGVFARGDRRLGEVLIRAFEKGCKFDGWQEHFKYNEWMEAIDECGLDPAFYANRRREYDEILPWDHIDVGVTKQYLVNENEKSKEEKLTSDCRDGCTGCGINNGFIGGVC